MTLTATQMAIMSAISTVAKIGSSFMQSSGQSAGAGMQAELARRQAAREFSARILENNAAARVNAARAEEVLQRSRMNQFNQAGLMRAGSALLKGGSQIAQLKF